MNNREEILTRINQNEISRQLLIDEGKKLVDELQELDEPKLKHGDYGIDENEIIRLRLENWNKEQVEAGTGCCDFPNKELRLKTKFGNIFDDLKVMQGSLEEFTLYCGEDCGKIKVRDALHDNTSFRLEQGSSIILVPHNKLKELSNLLRKAYITRMKKNNNKTENK